MSIEPGSEVNFIIAFIMFIITILVFGGAILFVFSLARPQKSKLKIMKVIRHPDGPVQFIMSDGTNRWDMSSDCVRYPNYREPSETFYNIVNQKNKPEGNFSNVSSFSDQ